MTFLRDMKCSMAHISITVNFSGNISLLVFFLFSGTVNVYIAVSFKVTRINAVTAIMIYIDTYFLNSR